MVYDLLIIGQGISGLTASIYASRYKVSHVVIGKELGGVIVDALQVENYPGFPRISGLDLMQRVTDHAKGFGTQIIDDEVLDVERSGDVFLVKTAKERYEARMILFASGRRKRRLDAKNEPKFRGKGVAYCATCDAPFYTGKTVAVVGGSDAALLSIILLSEFASRIYVIYRGDRIRGDQLNVARVERDPKVLFIYNTHVRELQGWDHVEKIILDNGKELKVDAVFVEIGSDPETRMAKKLGVYTDEKGYIFVDKLMATNVPGIFASGDITNASEDFKQLVSAAGQGAIAAYSAYNHKMLLEMKKGGELLPD